MSPLTLLTRLRRRSLLGFAVLAALSAPIANALAGDGTALPAAAEVPAKLTLPDLINMALEKQPALAAAR